MTKKWCIPTFHPLAKQVAKKYRISDKEARNILNIAKSNNNALDYDKMTVDDLESYQEFNDALKTYTEQLIKSSDIFGYIGGSKLADIKDDLREILERDVNDEIVSDLIDYKDDIKDVVNLSKISSVKIASLLKGFKSPKRMEFLGQYMCRRISELITILDTDRNERYENGISKQNSRALYYNDPKANRYIISTIVEEFKDRIAELEKDGNSDLASELKTAINNFRTMIYMYGGNLFRDEGIKVNPNETSEASGSTSTSAERNDTDDENDGPEDDDDVEKETMPVSLFSVSDQNKSVYSKIVPEVKILLANCRDIDSNGNFRTDQFGFGLPTYISVSKALNILHKICDNCANSDEVFNAIRSKQEVYPWMTQIIQMLDTNDALDMNGVDMSSDRKEQLRTLFFQSVYKPFTRFRTTYTSANNGDMCFKNRDANTGGKYDRMMNKVRSMFASMSGPMFENTAISFDNIRQLRKQLSSPVGRIRQDDKSVEGIVRNALGMANSGASAEEVNKLIEDATKKLSNILKALGIDMSKTAIHAYSRTGNYDNTKHDNQTRLNNTTIIGNQILKLQREADSIMRSLIEWGDAIEDGSIPDTPVTNPMSMRKDASTRQYTRKIVNGYSNLINLITSVDTDSQESAAYMNGKSYYSRNNPSSIGTIISRLKNTDRQKVREYIESKYGKDTLWFIKPNEDKADKDIHFYSDWLEDIYHNNGNIIEYAEQPIVNGKDYTELSDLTYALSIMNDYHNQAGEMPGTAWYRSLIASDKPRNSLIRGRRYSNNNIEDIDGSVSWAKDNYHVIIADKAVDFFSQEIRRAENVARFAAFGTGTRVDNYDIEINTPEKEAVINKMRDKKKVSINDVVKDGKYIFRNTGASFFMSKFINNEIEKGSELGKYVVDRIFNSHLSTKPVRVITPKASSEYKKVFHDYMSELRDKFSDYMKSIGAYEKKTINAGDNGNIKIDTLKYLIGNMMEWHSGDIGYTKRLYEFSSEAAKQMALKDGYTDETYGKDTRVHRYYMELANFQNDIEEFVYNNWLAKANMSEIFDVDLAFYKNTTNFQKRNAQVVSAGYPIDPTAKIHGSRVTDGKYRSITIRTKKIKAPSYDAIESALRKQLEKITDNNERAVLEKAVDNTLKSLTKFDATDGQAFTGLTGLRKRMVGLGKWTRSNSRDEDINGVTTINGKEVKIYTDEAVYQRIKNNKQLDIYDYLHVFGQPQKPFVYSMVNMNRAGRGDGQITVPVQHKNSEYALIYITAFQQKGKLGSQAEAIAKFLEETAEDNELTGIDTANFDSAVKIGGNDDAIELEGLSAEDTLKALREALYVTDKNGNYVLKDGKKVRRADNPVAVTEYDVEDYKIVQEKPEHFKHNAQPLGAQMKILCVNNIKDDETCVMPNGKKITGKELKNRYFKALSKKTMNSEKEFRRSLGLNMPHSSRIHRLSYTLKSAMASDQRFTSDMRRSISIVNRDGVDQFVLPLDDPSQQLSVEAMLYSKIRKSYYKEKTNGGVVVQATSWASADDLRIVFDNDGNYQYFEIEAPMPDYVLRMLERADGGVDRFLNSDGTWNMDEIHKVVPDSAFDAICYRIPTEMKYSIMKCRIKRFTPSWAGSVAKYPKELTLFTGADFDIDTDFVELRPIDGSDDYDVDKEIFDLQWAALGSNSGILEGFRPGDFDDLSAMSYYVTLLANGYDKDILDGMSKSRLKSACEDVEDMDLMDPKTDVLLRKQNMDASKMIGIAAVGVTAHAFISVYNDEGVSSGRIENTTRLLFKEGSDKSVTESFKVINDSDPEHQTEKRISGAVTLDAINDMDNKLISAEIGKYVGASADAAKDAALYRLNITQQSMPILILMHRLGISSDVARMFIAQPVVRRVMDKINISSAFGHGGMDSAIDDVLSELAETEKPDNMSWENWQTDFVAKINDVKHDQNITLRYSDLVRNISDPESQTLYDKLKILQVLDTLRGKEAKVRNLDSFARYNSMTAMKGSSFFDRLVARKKIERLVNNLNSENSTIKLPDNISISDEFTQDEFGKLCTMFPHVGRVILGEQEMTDQIILENMHTYNETFFEAARKLGILDSDTTGDNVDKLNTLYEGYKSYLLFLGENRIEDFTNPETVKFYTTDFEEYYTNTLDDIKKSDETFYNTVIKNNSFIQGIGHLDSKDGYRQFGMLKTDINYLRGPELEMFQKDWADLLRYPQTHDFVINITKHFLARSTSFSNTTPISVMPLAIKEAIPNYTRAFFDADKTSMSEKDMFELTALVCLNNSQRDKGIVPYFENKPKRQVVTFSQAEVEGGQTIVLEIDEKLGGKIKNWISGRENELTITMPVINVDGNFFLVNNTSVERVKKGDDYKLLVSVDMVDPMGIPNQMLEYVKLGDVYNGESLFANTGEQAPDPNLSSDETSAIEPMQDDAEESGFAAYLNSNVNDDTYSGTFISTNPYGDDNVEVPIPNALASDPLAYREPAFLESRRHLKRISKIASLFGMSDGQVERMVKDGKPTYSINLKPNGSAMDQHREAIKTAAIMDALSDKPINPVVKTYTSDIKECNAVEVVVKLNNKAYAQNKESVISAANKTHLEWEYNGNRQELRFFVDINPSDMTALRASMMNGIDTVKSSMGELSGAGLIKSDKVAANFIIKDNISDYDVYNVINSLSNGRENENEPDDGGQNPEDAERSGNRAWQPVRIGDIISIAKRKLHGEASKEEIAELFGERMYPLSGARESYRSYTLSDKVIDSMEEDVYDEIYDVMESDEKASINPASAMDNLIIQTANWILANRPTDALVDLMNRKGISSDSAESVINTIDNILNELDIC